MCDKCETRPKYESTHIQLLEYVIPPAAAAVSPKSPRCYGVNPCYGVNRSEPVLWC